MQSSKEPNQHTGGLGDVKAMPVTKPDEKEERWLPVDGHHGYVKSTKTGAIKHKDS